MGQLPFNIGEILSAPGIRPQMRAAVDALAQELKHSGAAYRLCDTWQRRFEWALRGDIPDWTGLAGFRFIVDFGAPLNKSGDPAVFPLPRPQLQEDECPRSIDTYEKLWRAYHQYFHAKKSLYSGKLDVRGEAERYLLANLDDLDPLLGGQAGNVFWLWHCIGAQFVGFSPYTFSDLTNVARTLHGLEKQRLLRFDSGRASTDSLMDVVPGVQRKDRGGTAAAPSGGSVVVAKEGRRLIYMFQGLRDLRQTNDTRPWTNLEITYDGQHLLDEPVQLSASSELSWPSLPFFGECYLEDRSGATTLVIRLASEREVRDAVKQKVDFAVIGGIDSIFFDQWYAHDSRLRARLREIIMLQLRGMASAGVRIGMELSRVPSRDFGELLQQLCREGTVVALGINGIDELPGVVGRPSLDSGLSDFWLDPASMPPDEELRIELATEHQTDTFGPHFEYVTYRRAKRLAEATGVRTLYVHTNTLDFVLRRDADPGSLLRAQLGDMMGKGLVIAALLQRAAPDGTWENAPRRTRLTPAITPEAMVRLARFAHDFQRVDQPDSAERLLNGGYWVAPKATDLSLAVVPVLWPRIAEDGTSSSVFSDVNTTGAGDMSMAAFLLLGGV
jgi:hypothetical protein